MTIKNGKKTEIKVLGKAVSHKAYDAINGDLVWSKPHNREHSEKVLMCVLIGDGFTYSEMWELFRENPCAGWFSMLHEKNEKLAEHYFMTQFLSALEWYEEGGSYNLIQGWE